MLTAIAIVPSAPVMVPRLAGAAAAELTGLRDAVLTVAAALPARWVAVGAGPQDTVIDASQAGTFAGYGADERVTLSRGDGASPVDLPLCALIAGWIRGQAQPTATAQARVYAAGLDAGEAIERGRRLRAELDAADEQVGVLVVADGANTLTPPAPGGYDPDSVAVQQALDDALAGGDVAALHGLPDAVVGRVAFQVLAGVAEPAPRSAEELYRGAPYGVGYFVGLWTP
ncbi:hypothetical protein H7I41_24880 [Mycobacterium manitobense]|uniref:Uncharacterized protein n=1 Tax=[Mycobacterium] manitobense TaxID=190147 RepID=A0A9X3BZV0_9MYCO|nr:hypothetical protein [[Mycobacterium] manitobense]MCV7173162.1 hypothetical protein [[Mycobacterium] manitobense]